MNKSVRVASTTAKAVDKFSTPARRRRIIADVAVFLLQQYCLKACNNVHRKRVETAASIKIQCGYRQHRAREALAWLRYQQLVFAATRMQSWWRMMIAKRLLFLLKRQEWLRICTRLAVALQCLCRVRKAKKKVCMLRAKRFAERHGAGIIIQALWRGALARMERVRRHNLKLIQNARNISAAVAIQRFSRGFIARQRFKIMRRRSNAATLLSKIARGVVVRIKLKKNKAAVPIQTALRGFLQRIRYQHKKTTARAQAAARLKAQQKMMELDREEQERALMEIEDTLSRRMRTYEEELMLARQLALNRVKTPPPVLPLHTASIDLTLLVPQSTLNHLAALGPSAVLYWMMTNDILVVDDRNQDDINVIDNLQTPLMFGPIVTSILSNAQKKYHFSIISPESELASPSKGLILSPSHRVAANNNVNSRSERKQDRQVATDHANIYETECKRASRSLIAGSLYVTGITIPSEKIPSFRNNQKMNAVSELFCRWGQRAEIPDSSSDDHKMSHSPNRARKVIINALTVAHIQRGIEVVCECVMFGSGIDLMLLADNDLKLEFRDESIPFSPPLPPDNLKASPLDKDVAPIVDDRWQCKIFVTIKLNSRSHQFSDLEVGCRAATSLQPRALLQRFDIEPDIISPATGFMPGTMPDGLGIRSVAEVYHSFHSLPKLFEGSSFDVAVVEFRGESRLILRETSCVAPSSHGLDSHIWIPNIDNFSEALSSDNNAHDDHKYRHAFSLLVCQGKPPEPPPPPPPLPPPVDYHGPAAIIQKAARRRVEMKSKCASAICRILKQCKILRTWRVTVILAYTRAFLCAQRIQSIVRMHLARLSAINIREFYCRKQLSEFQERVKEKVFAHDIKMLKIQSRFQEHNLWWHFGLPEGQHPSSWLEVAIDSEYREQLQSSEEDKAAAELENNFDCKMSLAVRLTAMRQPSRAPYVAGSETVDNNSSMWAHDLITISGIACPLVDTCVLPSDILACPDTFDAAGSPEFGNVRLQCKLMDGKSLNMPFNSSMDSSATPGFISRIKRNFD